AQFEHAIAILVGKPPAALSIPARKIQSPPPIVPAGVPSVLLERRPDIAAAERQMAVANEQIGIAKTAYYPALTLSGDGGFQSGSFSNWFLWSATGPNPLRCRPATRSGRAGTGCVRCHRGDLPPDGLDGISAGGGQPG